MLAAEVSSGVNKHGLSFFLVVHLSFYSVRSEPNNGQVTVNFYCKKAVINTLLGLIDGFIC